MVFDITKVIRIAVNEIGYLEKASLAELDDKTKNAGSNNITKYWRDMAPGMQKQAWCNCFINWCFVQAYGELQAKKLLCSEQGWSYYTPTSAQYFKNKGQWYTREPEVGDLIFFKNSTRINHVGLVVAVDSNKVYTVEGNTSNKAGVVPNGGCVAKKCYQLTYTKIAGFGRPLYYGAPAQPITSDRPTIRFGSKNEHVKYLHQRLRSYHYGVSADQDFFDSLTRTCVIDFQANHNLVSDGIVGPKTWAALG